jgi:hypothetical protein
MVLNLQLKTFFATMLVLWSTLLYVIEVYNED